MVQSRRSNDVASVLRRLALISLAPGASGQLLCSIFATGWFCLCAWCGSIISAAARTFSPVGEECHQTLHGPAAADTKGLWLCSLGKLPDGKLLRDSGRQSPCRPSSRIGEQSWPSQLHGRHIDPQPREINFNFSPDRLSHRPWQSPKC